MLSQRGKVAIKPVTLKPSESPTSDVKTPDTVPSPMQVAGMVLLTAIVTAVSTALAMRIF
jgi:hypothetical protein